MTRNSQEEGFGIYEIVSKGVQWFLGDNTHFNGVINLPKN
jgi:hypothetical protein